MTRAYGKNTPRGGGLGALVERLLDDSAAGETEGQRREQGQGDPRDIPGGLNHLANPPVVRQEVPGKPQEWAFDRADLAHGVPQREHGLHDRDPRLSAPNSAVAAKLEGEPPGPDPVPVYIVEQAAGPRPRAITGTKRLTVPAGGSEPIQIVAEDPHRSLIQILNEDSSHHARFGQLGDLAWDAANSVVIGGSRLPANATSYMVIRTQGPLWAVSETSNTVAISVVTEFQLADAG